MFCFAICFAIPDNTLTWNKAFFPLMIKYILKIQVLLEALM